MKKYNFYLWLTVLVGLFASCSQDEAAGPQTNTESNRVTLTASLPDNFAQIGTRANPDIPSGMNLRCILEVWTQGDNPALKIRQEKEFKKSDNINIVFDFTLDEGTYDCLFWADYIQTSTIPSNVTIGDVTFQHYFDQFYITTDATNGLKAITLDEKKHTPYLNRKEDYRDAFFGHYELQKEAAAVENPAIAPLTRALAKLTIKEKNATNYAACEQLTVAYAVPKGFNVLTGTASTTYNVEATFSKYWGSTDILFNDFIFTDASSTLGEIKLSFTGTNKNFLPVTIPAGIPLKRNYKTNASGNFISEQPAPTPGVKLTVEVNADWAGTQDTETDPTIWDGTYPTSEEEAKEWMGEPTISAAGETPATYTISTAKQLAGMAYYYRADIIEKATFELAADIDLAEHPWIPLGLFENINTTRSFKGTFNGHGHTIKGMNVTGNYNHSGFMAICAGTVKNLIVEGKVNSSINNAILNVECGGIAGEVSSAYTGTGDIIACGFRGTIVGSATSAKNAFSGGIAGYNEAGNITGCISWATSVTATGGSINNYFGGIVGFFNKYTNSQSHSTIQPTAKGNRWYYNGTGPEGVQELSGGTGTEAAPVMENNASFANNSDIDDTAITTLNSYLTDNDYIWQKAADGNLKLVKNQQP